MRDGILDDQDHQGLDRWFSRQLERLRKGETTQAELVGILGQIVGAIDIGNIGEFRMWTSGRNDR